MRIAFCTAAAALALAFPAQASSPYPDTNAVTVRVSLRDLDLGSPKDLATLRKRVRAAVRQACEAPSRNLFAVSAEQDCRIKTQAAANIQIERHRQRTLALLTLPRG